MTWLVTGGAGYIGRHIVNNMKSAGIEVVIVDDLSSGNWTAMSASLPFIEVSVFDHSAIRTILADYRVTGVIHLAGKKSVSESLTFPSRYFSQNVEALRLLLDECVCAGVTDFLFSSTAAVYGDPGTTPVAEQAPCTPMNPYGKSKLAGEWSFIRLDRHTASVRWYFDTSMLRATIQ